MICLDLGSEAGVKEFKIEMFEDPRGVVVRISGAMDVGNLAAIEGMLKSITGKTPKVVVMDLKDATLISSVCIGALVVFRRAVIGKGGVVYVAAPGPMVADEIRRVALQQLFPVIDSVEDALNKGN